MRGLIIICSALALAPMTLAAEPTYWQEVRPLLRKHCTVCHSVKHLNEPDISAGLALDSLEAIRKGGKVPLIEAKKGASSLLVTILREKNVRRRMPLDADPLSDADVAVFQRWIDAGMPEGTKRDDVVNATVKPTITRKRDVILPIKSALPKALAVGGKTGPVDLSLPVGPLTPVTALAYSPDGRLLASGSYGLVSVWDLTAGKPAKMLTNVLGAVNDLRFSPDGKWLAVAGGQPSARGDLRLYQTSDWKLIQSLGGHSDVVASVAFSPDGKQIASASFDKSVRLWNLPKGDLVATLMHHSDFVYSVAFDPKGQWLISASKDRTCRVINTKTLTSQLTLSGMNEDVLAVGVTSDGAQIVSSGFEPQLHWWNAQTGERTKRQGGHGTATHELGFSADGAWLASAGADKTVRLWNGKTGDAVRSFPAETVPFAVAIRPDGKQIAGAGFDGQVRVWDATTARLLVSMLAFQGANDSIDWLMLTPEGFLDASPALIAQGKWRVAGQMWTGKALWSTFQKANVIPQALRGEKLEEPKF